MVTTFYPPYSFGGDALYVYRLCQELAARGHRVEVLHCRDSYDLLAGTTRRAEAAAIPGVVVHGLRSPWGKLSPLAVQQTGLPLLSSRHLRAVLEQPFDTIHFHNVSLLGGPGVLRLGRALKLYTLHEHWLVCPTHVLFKFQNAPCVQKSCLACQLAARRPPQWWRWTPLLRRCLENVDAFLAPSRFTLERHARELSIPLRHLPSFAVPCTARRAPDAPPYFLFVGRLEKIKGLQTVLGVFRRHPGYRLKIAGDGLYGEVLRRQARDCPNVEFLGWVEGGQLERLYASALAVLVPSIGLETLGQVVLEAFAAGTPVIARRLGPLTELIEESQAGFLFEDDRGLEDSLERLCREAGLRDRLGGQAEEAWRQRWRPDQHVDRYLALNDELQAARA